MVKIANLAQVVNVGAPLFVEGERLVLQANFFPFEMYAKRREGVSLWPVVKGAGYETHDYGYAQIIDASAILGDDRLHVFLVNRSLEESHAVTLALFGQRLAGLESAEILTGPGPFSMNTLEKPDLIASQPFSAVAVEPGRAKLELPPLSVAALTFKVKL